MHESTSTEFQHISRAMHSDIYGTRLEAEIEFGKYIMETKQGSNRQPKLLHQIVNQNYCIRI